jgi:phosphate transport system protein
MRWKRGVGRGGIIDRRGSGYGGRRGMPIPMMGGGLGGVGLLIVLALVFGSQILGGGGGGTGIDPGLDPFGPTPAATRDPNAPDPDAKLKDFVAFVHDDVQDSWARSFAEGGRRYEETKVVLFTDATSSGCGSASSATGPFYCPADRLVYIDLSFFRELESRFGAPGDFAQAYVVAHEIGHHVQTLLGITRQKAIADQQDPAGENARSVRFELQADCFAGVWAHSAYRQGAVSLADIQDALDAAAREVQERILLVMARQAPVASDLRVLAALLHVIKHAERMGDQCVNVAKILPLDGTTPPVDDHIQERILEMGRLARSEVTQCKTAFELRDVALAKDLVRQDEQINRLQREVFRQAIESGIDSDRREWAMHMVIVARCLERIGDNAVDVGEQVAFVVTGLFREFSDSSHPAGISG